MKTFSALSACVLAACTVFAQEAVVPEPVTPPTAEPVVAAPSTNAAPETTPAAPADTASAPAAQEPATNTVAAVQPAPEAPVMTGIYQFTLKDIDGADVSLSAYTGKVVMIVNVASKCGFTSQYAGLEKLYRAYKDKGFVILGFPANNFLSQEPGTEAEIKAFCTTKYNVSFPMFSKISVSGDDKHPLYKYLTAKETNPKHSGRITWNFNKFIIGPDGAILDRFGSRTRPEDPAIIKTIQNALK